MLTTRVRITRLAAMKYLPHFLLGTAALSLFCFATPMGASDTVQLGPHSMQKFAIVRRAGLRTIDPKAITTMALILTVEQKMNGKEQEVVAKASAHQDGPHGAMASAQGVQVRIIEPGPPIASPPRTTSEVGEVNVHKTFPAPGGKYKTVTAEATMQNPDFIDAHVILTIPGGK